MRKGIGVISFAVLILAGCGVNKKTSSADRLNTLMADAESSALYTILPEKLGYTGEILPTYYYTEGVKVFNAYGASLPALEYFHKAIEADSTHSPSYYEAANALALSNPALALEFSIKANELDTTNMWYKAQLGRLYIVNSDYDNAKVFYEKLIALSPRNPENYSMLAALYEYTRQPFAAIAMLDKAEAIVGKNELTASYKRELLVKVGLVDRAIEEAKEMVNAYPYNYENYLALAELYGQTRKDSLAIENYDIALALNPDGVDVLASMNEYYKEKGNYDKFLETANRLFRSEEVSRDMKVKFFREIASDRNFYRDNYFRIKDLAAILMVRYPGDYEVLEIYTDTQIAYGDVEGALQLYKDYVADSVSRLEPFQKIIDIETYLQRPDSMDKYTRLALHYFPDNSEIYIRQGSALMYLDRQKEAFKAYDQAYKLSTTDSAKSVVLGIIGDEYHRVSDKKKYSYYDRALKLWPDNIVVLNNYAYFLSEENRELEKALRMAQRVMELEPGRSTYIDTYGWVLYKMGRLEEAKVQIRQAIAADPDNSPELLLHYGDILYDLSDVYMATVYWKRALEAGADEEKINERLEKAQSN